MLHLSLLVASLVSASLAARMLCLSTSIWQSWRIRRSLQLTGLFMPFSLLLFFSIMNLPAIIERPQQTIFDQANQAEWVAGFTGLLLLLGVFTAALFYNLYRLGLVWLYLLRRTWPAPSALQNQLDRLTPTGLAITLRIVHSAAPLAYTVSFLPGTRRPNWIIISSSLAQETSSIELASVLSHELAHVKRADFWIMWLAGFLRDAFFYMPAAHQLYELLAADKEFASDELAVVSHGIHHLDLALMLIKIWERALDDDSAVHQYHNHYHQPIAVDRAPGLTRLFARDNAGSRTEAELLEQRIRRLMAAPPGQGSGYFSFTGRSSNTVVSWLPLGWLLGSVLLWSVTVVVINIVMLPLGCAIGSA